MILHRTGRRKSQEVNDMVEIKPRSVSFAVVFQLCLPSVWQSNVKHVNYVLKISKKVDSSPKMHLVTLTHENIWDIPD